MDTLEKVTSEKVNSPKDEMSLEMQNKLASCIRVCLELESAFKLYSYRITTPELFMEMVETTVKYLDNANK